MAKEHFARAERIQDAPHADLIRGDDWLAAAPLPFGDYN